MHNLFLRQIFGIITDLLKKLKSDDKKLWPEVDFVENFVGVSTKRIDTLAEKEGGVGNVNFIFESNDINDKYPCE